MTESELIGLIKLMIFQIRAFRNGQITQEQFFEWVDAMDEAEYSREIN